LAFADLIEAHSDKLVLLDTLDMDQLFKLSRSEDLPPV